MNLIFKDAAGNQIHYDQKIYDLQYSYTQEGGPLSLSVTIPIDLIGKKIDLIYDVLLYDDLDEIWLGRISEMPRVTQDRQAAIITAKGYFSHILENPLMRHYTDTGYAEWDVNPPVAMPESYNWSDGVVEKDNNNRLYMHLINGQTIKSGSSLGLYYRLCNIDRISQAIYSVTFDYELGSDVTANVYGRLASYDSDITNIAVEWSLQGTGALQTGSVTQIITAGKKGLIAYLGFGADKTAANNNCYLKITNIRVNGLSTFTSTYQADEVIKDLLANYAPSVSTDQTKISNGAYTIPTFFVDKKTSVLDVIKELNKYERYNYGFWDRGSDTKPRFTYAAHDKATIHYTTSLRAAKPELSGESLDDQFNAVDVEYDDPVIPGRKLVARRTATHALLNTWGITRAPAQALQAKTTSAAAANQVGDAFLTDKAQRQGKGSITVRLPVRSSAGTITPPWRILPGRNIMIRDLEPSPADLTTMTSSNVLNGKNIFRIVEVSVNYTNKEATLSLDNIGDNLAVMLSRRGWA